MNKSNLSGTPYGPATNISSAKSRRRALPPELGQGIGQVVLRVPPATNVVLTPRVAAVVDHPAFQRLRQVLQLGPTHMVYPGATHTRFEHSLGVYHTAIQYLKHLLEIPAFADIVTEEDMMTVLAAALLHDLGHYPMAHSLEALHLKGNDTPRHEDLAGDIIRGEIQAWRGQRPIGEILAEEWRIDPERAIALFTQSRRTMTKDKDALLASIISSGIDADKMDYLARDSHHMGVPYGRQTDRHRLLDSLTVAGDGRSLALTNKGLLPAEMFIFSRYTMFSEAYWHHTVRSVSAMIEAALADLQAEGHLGGDRHALAEDLLARGDAQLLEWLFTLSPEGSQAHALLSGLTRQRRGLYKRVLTLSGLFREPRTDQAYAHLKTMDNASLRQLVEATRQAIADDLGVHIAPGELILDTPPRDKDHLEDVEVVFPALAGHRVRRLTDISGVVKALSADFLRVVKKTRLFVAPQHAQALRARQAELEPLFLSLIEAHAPASTS